MNKIDEQIAEKIWPTKMNTYPEGTGGRYDDRIEAAKRWLGDRLLISEKNKQRKGVYG